MSRVSLNSTISSVPCDGNSLYDTENFSKPLLRILAGLSTHQRDVFRLKIHFTLRLARKYAFILKYYDV